MALTQVGVILACLAASCSAQKPKNVVEAHLAPSAAGGALRGAAINASTHLHTQKSPMPCQCQVGGTDWVASTRTVPKCIFIDLGAADGNTLRDFVGGKYGPVANCPSGGQWEATLVEANPRFATPLAQEVATYPSMVSAASSTARAAYMCEGQTTFYLDTTSVEHNYWGSSMSANHDDTKKSGLQAVTVPTVNVLKILHETTIPGDYVILKMDVEGAEWDILPCMAQSPDTSLVDRLYVEVHPQTWGNAGTTQVQMDAALAAVRTRGVDIPGDYHSQTL